MTTSLVLCDGEHRRLLGQYKECTKSYQTWVREETRATDLGASTTGVTVRLRDYAVGLAKKGTKMPCNIQDDLQEAIKLRMIVADHHYSNHDDQCHQDSHAGFVLLLVEA